MRITEHTRNDQESLVLEGQGLGTSGKTLWMDGCQFCVHSESVRIVRQARTQGRQVHSESSVCGESTQSESTHSESSRAISRAHDMRVCAVRMCAVKAHRVRAHEFACV